MVSGDSIDARFLLVNKTRLNLNAFGRRGLSCKGVVLALHAG
jgi:hypothetical protein